MQVYKFMIALLYNLLGYVLILYYLNIYLGRVQLGHPNLAYISDYYLFFDKYPLNQIRQLNWNINRS